MPIEIAPNRIELSDLSGGYAPDALPAATPMNASADVYNLLAEPWGNELRMRNGSSRLSAGRLASLNGHWIRHLNYYEVIDSGQRKRYLIAILTNGTNAAVNNIRIYAYDLVNNTFTRIDTAGRSWAKANTEHWYAIVEGTYYGGTRGEVIYSWHPTDGWNSDPTTPNSKTWVDGVGGSVTPASQYGRDHAFKKGTKALYSGQYYSALRDIRYKTWETGQRYSKGERVSRKDTTGATYWKSFECIKSHDSDSTNKPFDGSGSPGTYWKKVRLRNIKDEDGEVTSDWAYMPLPGKGVVGAYHGNRLWVRHDDADNWARLQYSAPARPEKDSLIADLDWRPADWAPVDDVDGDGGGWLTIPFSGKGDAIRALQSLDNYLIVSGRWQTYVLAGTNEQTWTVRKLGDYGAIGPQAICVLDGICYMLGREGVLTMTDGTSMQIAPGMEKIRKYMKNAIDNMVAAGAGTDNDENWKPSMVAHDGRIWISLPDQDAFGDFNTLVYDPRLQSFWLTDLQSLDMAVGELRGTSRLWFSAPISGTATQYPCVFQYKDDPGNEVWTDDDFEAADGSTHTNAIGWNYGTAWFQFGMAHMERRLRRAWALVRGATSQVTTVDVALDFDDTSVTTNSGTHDADHTNFIEAKVGQTTTAHAVKVYAYGSASAKTSLFGFGIDTEPIRTRFHK